MHENCQGDGEGTRKSAAVRSANHSKAGCETLTTYGIDSKASSEEQHTGTTQEPTVEVKRKTKQHSIALRKGREEGKKKRTNGNRESKHKDGR